MPTLVSTPRRRLAGPALALAAAAFFGGCADDDVRTYEVYLSAGNFLGDATDGNEPTYAFVSTLRQSTDQEPGWFGYRERTDGGWTSVLDVRDVKRIWPAIGTVGFAELQANAAGQLGFCGYPNLVAHDLGAGFVFADLTALPTTAFRHVEPLAGSRFVFLGESGLFVDWREDGWELRTTLLDTVLVSAWTDDDGTLLVASASGVVLREEGDGWTEVLQWTGSGLGPSVAAPGGGRYFNGGQDGGVLYYDKASLTPLPDVQRAPWWRPRPLGESRFAMVSADLATVIGFDAATWWVEAEFPGREVNDVWSPDGERLLVVTITPSDRWWGRRAALHERTDGVWTERDLHAMFGTEPASGGAKARSPLAPEGP